MALLLGAAGLWVAAAGVFGLIREQPGATEGGGNALAVAVASNVTFARAVSRLADELAGVFLRVEDGASATPSGRS